MLINNFQSLHRLLGVIVGQVLSKATKQQITVHHVTLIGLHKIAIQTEHGSVRVESIKVTLNLFSDSL